MSRLKLLALAVITSTFATSALAGTANTGSLVVGNATANQGDTGVQLAISLDALASTSDGVAILTFSVNFDDALCDHLSNFAVAATGRTLGTPEISGNGCENVTPTGSLMFNLSDPSPAITVPDGSGPIINLTFDVSGSAPTNGPFPLTLADVAAGFGPVTVLLSQTNGQLTINGVSNTPANTATATNTPTATNTQTATSTATNTSAPTDTPTDGPTPTPSNTPTASNTPTSSNTPSNTATQTNTETPSNTPTASDTPTATATFTNTNTPTNTPIPTPRITGGDDDGSGNVSGTGAGNANIELRTVPGGEVLGSTTSNPNGSFFIPLSRALSAGESIQLFDTTNNVQGPVTQVNAPPAPIPAIDPVGAALLIMLMAAGLLWRLRASNN